jgi:hypothetical protein
MPSMDAAAFRKVGELVCDCDNETVVKFYEDGDMQDDGSILWSGLAAGTCKTCGQSYADWWEGTSKIGEPTLPPNGSSGADR